MAPEADSLLEQGVLSIEKDIKVSRWDTLMSWSNSTAQTISKLQIPLFKRSSGRLRPTAYLDGMRGFAALLVYILHNEIWGEHPT